MKKAIIVIAVIFILACATPEELTADTWNVSYILMEKVPTEHGYASAFGIENNVSLETLLQKFYGDATKDMTSYIKESYDKYAPEGVYVINYGGSAILAIWRTK